jgi:hypothetical protein
MAMNYKKRLLMAFGALALAISAFIVPAQAAKARCTSEECACEAALKQNTVEALEEFLRKYPQSVNDGQSACAALAVPSEGEPSGGQGSGDARTPIQSDGSPHEG